MTDTKEQWKLDRVKEAMLGMVAVPNDVDKPKHTLKDMNRRYRLKSRNGKTMWV